ncbi:MAG: tetratricopeptide repeat protein [Fimbriimonadaceae bacterium]|nr:tetratricopeptide repeat protein [Fimbriimonadaceae bacterium]QYK55565.1 MAG: tetratricopeptide repeat protein [Fimbriimonadaceae bacterium]
MAPTDPRGLAEVDAQVAEGQRLFGEGRVAEALMVCDAVLVVMPTHVPALALKGDCLETQNDIAGALECYERVIEMRPDSALDRIRVAHLRRAAHKPVYLEPERPDRRNAIFAAIAACILLVSTASALFLATRKTTDTGSLVADNNEVSKPFVTPVPVSPNKQPSELDAQSTPAVNERGQQGAEQTNEQTLPDRTLVRVGDETPAQRNNIVTSRPQNLEGARPNVSSQGNSSGYAPLEPYVTPESAPKTQPEKPPVNNDPEPKSIQPQNADGRSKTNRQAIIDVRPSPGSTEVTRGGSVVLEANDANEGEALVRTARQQFLSGKFADAARTYERALKLGVSPASANHRLAQCYVNLKRRPEAKAAYERALSAYERMLEKGQGDPKLIQSYIDECKQAIGHLE